MNKFQKIKIPNSNMREAFGIWNFYFFGI